MVDVTKIISLRNKHLKLSQNVHINIIGQVRYYSTLLQYDLCRWVYQIPLIAPNAKLSHLSAKEINLQAHIK